MKDQERITKWINTILQEISKLDANKGIELLHACGSECSKASALLEGAIKIRNEYEGNENSEKIFKAFKKQYYNTSRFTKGGNKITLIFEECTCPMVKEGVNNSYLCNCTIGHSLKIFETLFDKPVKVKLLKSVLNGDNICKQEILVKDV